MSFSLKILLKVPWSALKHAALIYVVTLFQLKQEDRAGHIEQPRPLFKIASSVLFICARARALLELGKAACDSHILIDYPLDSIWNS